MRAVNGGRGMVLEVEGDSALVLTRDGEFRWVRLDDQPRELGREVAFAGPAARVRARPAAFLRPAVAAACIALLLVALWPGLGGPGMVAAYVSVDINPSLELAVDGRGRVIEGLGLDPDGEGLLRAVGPVRGRTLEQVLSRLIERAWEDRLLGPEGQNMVVVAASPAAAAFEELLARLEAAALQVAEQLGRPRGVVVAAIRTEAAIREDARELGLSAGRYAVLLCAQAEGLAVEVEDVRGKPLAAAIQAAGGSPGQVVAEAAKATVREDLAEKFGERNKPLPPGLSKVEDEAEPPPAGPASDQPPGQEKRDGPGPGAGPPGQDKKDEKPEPPGQEKDDRPEPPGQGKDDRPEPPGQGKDDRPEPPGQEKDSSPEPPGHKRDDRPDPHARAPGHGDPPGRNKPSKTPR